MMGESTVLGRMREDVQTVFAKDPAAKGVWEVLLFYPGLHAIWLHRLAHLLWNNRVLFLARLISHINRWMTGVEIHPRASIGRRFFVDHGMGVVIGETAEVGDDVLMYQGVVLGGTSVEKRKRHPTVGSNVVIGAGATLLGPITIGDGARIGAGSVVVRSVPAGTTAVGVPAHVAGPRLQAETEMSLLEHGRLPDPVLRLLSKILERQSRLGDRLDVLEESIGGGSPVPSTEAKEVAADQAIMTALRKVIHPETGLNVVDLGLIKAIQRNGRGLEVRIVLASSSHSMSGYLVEQVRRQVRRVAHDEPLEVVLQDEPSRWEDRAFRLRSGGRE